MKMDIKEILGYTINTISIAAFIFLASVIDYPFPWPYFLYIGLILLGFGIFLVVISILTQIRNRGKGLIDWGIYGIVRHPMYLGAMLLFLSWTFLLPHWLTSILSIANIAIVYWFILQGELKNIDLFGREYVAYSKRVPRLNIFTGFLKYLSRK